jgi:hypothetical protein
MQRVLEVLEVFFACLAERAMRLASGRQIQPAFSGFGPERLNSTLSLLAGDTFAFTTDNAVNTLAVDHYIDAVPTIPIGLALRGNAMFVDLRSRTKRPDSGACKAVET